MNILKEVKFDDNGLIPVIAQDNITEKVLMMAYMNKNALEDIRYRICTLL